MRLCILSPSIARAADVGGVSEKENQIANSSGSVTNQAIKVVQATQNTKQNDNGIA